MYKIKEIFYTLQGEGANTGTPATFIRFAGCNLWSGREKDRKKAICQFCDTDFVGGKSYSIPDLIGSLYPATWVVLTGGEPLLQVDFPLIHALHEAGKNVAVETNGTLTALTQIDWICVSPKMGTRLQQRYGDELKLVWPQAGMDPAKLLDLDFGHFFLQPMAGVEGSTQACIDYCLAHPRWRLSLQTHKILGLR